MTIETLRVNPDELYLCLLPPEQAIAVRNKMQAVISLAQELQRIRDKIADRERRKKKIANGCYAEYRAESAAIHAKQMEKYGAPLGARAPATLL